MPIDRANADELLSTTRAVRKRLDFSRPVPREIILDCIRIAQQAPTASNRQHWRWLVVTDPELRRRLAEIYTGPEASARFSAFRDRAISDGDPQTARVYDSASYLQAHMHEATALVVPCLMGQPLTEHLSSVASYWASIYPAVWSFNLALRARGLGTVLTTMHLTRADQAAKLLGIPDDVMQTCLLPVAYTKGDDFKPADRPPPESITYWDRWDG
jgi:nitroreductase